MSNNKRKNEQTLREIIDGTSLEDLLEIIGKIDKLDKMKNEAIDKITAERKKSDKPPETFMSKRWKEEL